MNELPLARKVINVIADRMAIDSDTIKMTSTFTGDLQADSLDLAEVTMDLEDAFGVKFPWNDEALVNGAFTTVADAVAYIAKETGQDGKH